MRQYSIYLSSGGHVNTYARDEVEACILVLALLEKHRRTETIVAMRETNQIK